MGNTFSIKLSRDELSERIGGGIPKGSIMLIEGPDGGGKSVIAQRLSYGFLFNKSKVSYISSELSTMGFVEQMLSLDYNITEKILNEELLFIPMFPSIGKVKLRDSFVDKLIKTKKIFEKDVIIIDSLSYLIIHERLSREKIFMIVKFFKTLTSMGKIVIISLDPALITEEFLKIIKSISDIYMTVESKEILGNVMNVCSINRFRGAESEITTRFPFSVRPGAGLSIEIASLS